MSRTAKRSSGPTYWLVIRGLPILLLAVMVIIALVVETIWLQPPQWQVKSPLIALIVLYLLRLRLFDRRHRRRDSRQPRS